MEWQYGVCPVVWIHAVNLSCTCLAHCSQLHSLLHVTLLPIMDISLYEPHCTVKQLESSMSTDTSNCTLTDIFHRLSSLHGTISYHTLLHSHFHRIIFCYSGYLKNLHLCHIYRLNYCKHVDKKQRIHKNK